jgi:hypothetical protein
MAPGYKLELPEYIMRPGIVVKDRDTGADVRDMAPVFNSKEFEKHSCFKENLNPVFVETGTFYGHGVVAAIAMGCVDIHSIEIESDLFGYTACMLDLLAYHHAYNFGVEGIETHRNSDFYSIVFGNKLRISLYRGDSCALLPKVLQRIDTKATFWLDGHYSGGETGRSEIGGDFPIYKELEAIVDHDIKNHTIMIDDMADFETNFPGELSKLKSIFYSINEKYTITKETKPDNEKSYVLLAKMNEDD